MAANEILPNLYLGDGKDLAEFRGSVVYVREDIPLKSRPDATWISFHRDGKADTTKLDAAAAAIEELLEKGDRVFVHCGAGTKRSPLAVAWYLHRYNGMTIDEAYDFIQARRPVVLRMTEWLGWGPSQNRSWRSKSFIALPSSRDRRNRGSTNSRRCHHAGTILGATPCTSYTKQRS